MHCANLGNCARCGLASCPSARAGQAFGGLTSGWKPILVENQRNRAKVPEPIGEARLLSKLAHPCREFPHAEFLNIPREHVISRRAKAYSPHQRLAEINNGDVFALYWHREILRVTVDVFGVSEVARKPSKSKCTALLRLRSAPVPRRNPSGCGAAEWL
jgi:hypothetical protein